MAQLTTQQITNFALRCGLPLLVIAGLSAFRAVHLFNERPTVDVRIVGSTRTATAIVPKGASLFMGFEAPKAGAAKPVTSGPRQVAVEGLAFQATAPELRITSKAEGQKLITASALAASPDLPGDSVELNTESVTRLDVYLERGQVEFSIEASEGAPELTIKGVDRVQLFAYQFSVSASSPQLYYRKGETAGEAPVGADTDVGLAEGATDPFGAQFTRLEGQRETGRLHLAWGKSGFAWPAGEKTIQAAEFSARELTVTQFLVNGQPRGKEDAQATIDLSFQAATGISATLKKITASGMEFELRGNADALLVDQRDIRGNKWRAVSEGGLSKETWMEYVFVVLMLKYFLPTAFGLLFASLIMPLVYDAFKTVLWGQQNNASQEEGA